MSYSRQTWPWSFGSWLVPVVTCACVIGSLAFAGVGRAPARFDLKKLENVNGHYMRLADDARLVALVVPRIAAAIGRDLTAADTNLLLRSMSGLKIRAKNINELADSAIFYLRTRPIPMDERAASLLTPEAGDLLAQVHRDLVALDSWTVESTEAAVRAIAESRELGLGKLAQPLRAAVTGSTTSPGIFEVLEQLGREESLGRIADAIGLAKGKQ